MSTTAATVSLSKGQNVNLTKDNPGLSKITVGLGWNPRVSPGVAFDLDASAFLLTEAGQVRSASDFIYYRNMVQAPESAVRHSGDNRDGAGDGDDETIKVDLSLVPAEIQKIVFVVSIHDEQGLGQNFGQVSNAYIRVLDDTNPDTPLARYDLTEESSGDTGMIFAELYRHNGEWKFKAIEEGISGGLAAACSRYGLSVE